MTETDKRPSVLAGVLCFAAFVAVFAGTLVYEFSGVRSGDPFAPFAALMGVLVAAFCGAIAAGGVLMLFGNLSE